MTQIDAASARVVGPSDAVPDDFVVPYYLEDRKLRVSVARVDGHLYAFDDLCTCAEPPGPLCGGLLTGATLMCQCHGSEWNLTSGDVVHGPATTQLRRYGVREVDGDIRIEV
jgi:3-phenylpropionate/trans-cinnamate dioxygenase ferredoxin subunit